MLIMLTDGIPMAGVTNPSDIRRLVKEEIAGEMSLFTLGFGNDVDSTLLEQLALENQVSLSLGVLGFSADFNAFGLRYVDDTFVFSNLKFLNKINELYLFINLSLDHS